MKIINLLCNKLYFDSSSKYKWINIWEFVNGVYIEIVVNEQNYIGVTYQNSIPQDMLLLAGGYIPETESSFWLECYNCLHSNHRYS